MMSLKEAVDKFEKDYNFIISTYISGKSGYDLIVGFYEAFVELRKEITRIENVYLDFFASKSFNKIDFDYMKFITATNWFQDVMKGLMEFYKEQISEEEYNTAVKYKFEMLQSNSHCIGFNLENFDNMVIYQYYFFRLENNLGFYDDTFITFSEFKESYKSINVKERADFIRWQNAQKIIRD